MSTATYIGPKVIPDDATPAEQPRSVSTESREWARGKTTSALIRWSESRASIRAELRAAEIM